VGVLTDKKNDKTLVGLCNLKGNEGLFRVTVWRGHLVIQRQCFPETINDHEVAPKADLTKAEVSKGLEMLDKLVSPFDAESYRNTIVDRQRKLIEATANGDAPVIEEVKATKVKKTTETVDVLAALESMGF
jgi:non-homologous end joining protein Ku